MKKKKYFFIPSFFLLIFCLKTKSVMVTFKNKTTQIQTIGYTYRFDQAYTKKNDLHIPFVPNTSDGNHITLQPHEVKNIFWHPKPFFYSNTFKTLNAQLLKEGYKPSYTFVQISLDVSGFKKTENMRIRTPKKGFLSFTITEKAIITIS